MNSGAIAETKAEDSLYIIRHAGDELVNRATEIDPT
jgi:hypothetical protein